MCVRISRAYKQIPLEKKQNKEKKVSGCKRDKSVRKQEKETKSSKKAKLLNHF